MQGNLLHTDKNYCH